MYYGLNKANLPKVDEEDNAEKVIEASGFQALEEEKSDDLFESNIEENSLNESK